MAPGFRLSGIDSLIGSSIRPNVAGAGIGGQPVETLFAQRGAQVDVQIPATVTNFAQGLFSLPTATSPLGNAEIAVMKSFRMPYLDGHSLNFRGDFLNLISSRNFGIPEARINNAGFLDQWNTDGGNRRIVFTLRYAF